MDSVAWPELVHSGSVARAGPCAMRGLCGSSEAQRACQPLCPVSGGAPSDQALLLAAPQGVLNACVTRPPWARLGGTLPVSHCQQRPPPHPTHCRPKYAGQRRAAGPLGPSPLPLPPPRLGDPNWSWHLSGVGPPACCGPVQGTAPRRHGLVCSVCCGVLAGTLRAPVRPNWKWVPFTHTTPPSGLGEGRAEVLARGAQCSWT